MNFLFIDQSLLLNAQHSQGGQLVQRDLISERTKSELLKKRIVSQRNLVALVIVAISTSSFSRWLNCRKTEGSSKVEGFEACAVDFQFLKI